MNCGTLVTWPFQDIRILWRFFLQDLDYYLTLPLSYSFFIKSKGVQMWTTLQWMTDYLSLRPKPDFFNLRLRLRPMNFMTESFSSQPLFWINWHFFPFVGLKAFWKPFEMFLFVWINEWFLSVSSDGRLLLREQEKIFYTYSGP